MPPLDSMASYRSPEEHEMQRMREELKAAKAYGDNLARQAQLYHSGAISPTSISMGSMAPNAAAIPTYLNAQINYNQPLGSVPPIGPFTEVQYLNTANRLYGQWESRPGQPTEFWLHPDPSIGPINTQTDQKMGDWQMGYDQGYEDGKAGK